jgi:crotonobetainyl-CoA:carnitine CoA-transferase CaiB-like acyl-CoA transferase
MLDIVGEVGGPPLALGGHQIDYSTGLIAFSSVMIALWGGDGDGGSGAGQDIAVSRYETGTYMEWKGRTYDQVGTRLQRGKFSGPLVVKVRDGYFGLFFNRLQYGRMVDYLGDERLREPRFATSETRSEHEAELGALLNEVLRDRTRQELYEAFQGMDMAVAPVLTAAEILESPQYLHRGFIVGNPAAGEQAREPGLPVTFNLVRPGAGPFLDAARKVVPS